MANSNIEWTGKVWNPVTGCNKVSPGCKNCYAEKMHKRLKGMGQLKYQNNFLDGANVWDADVLLPSKIKKPTTFFVNSMSDLFHEDISLFFPGEDNPNKNGSHGSVELIVDVMDICPQHTFQVLTKRPQRMQAFFSDVKHDGKYNIGVWPLRNVWLGTSVENQATAEARIPYLQNTPAHIRFLSMEPLLEAIDLEKVYARNGIEPNLDWIIVGGESGPKRRPFDPNWAREIRDWCKQYNIAFFMKQWDKVHPVPEDLQIREYPLKTKP
jgi:protein gp37